MTSSSLHPSSLSRRHRAIEATIMESKGMGFGKVAGLCHAKQALKEAIVFPVHYPHLFGGARQPWKRILLYGPPGTGGGALACMGGGGGGGGGGGTWHLM